MVTFNATRRATTNTPIGRQDVIYGKSIAGVASAWKPTGRTRDETETQALAQVLSRVTTAVPSSTVAGILIEISPSGSTIAGNSDALQSTEISDIRDNESGTPRIATVLGNTNLDSSANETSRGAVHRRVVQIELARARSSIGGNSVESNVVEIKDVVGNRVTTAAVSKLINDSNVHGGVGFAVHASGLTTSAGYPPATAR